MTELKNYNHAEQVINPDDLKQSEQHGADRLNTQAELAESRIKTISVSRAGGGGLDEYFSGMEHHTWSEGTPWEISRLVNKRVFDVVGDVAGNYTDTLKGSSGAQFEGQMMKYTADDMIKQIQNTRANGLHDQETLQTLKGFTASAQEGVKTQIEEMKTKQQEMIAERGWWSRTGHKALAIGSLGTYNLVKTEKRQKWYNKYLEKSVTKQFDKINKNIETLEKRAGKQVAPEQSRIRRTLEATSDPVEKAAYKKELMDAVKNTGTDLSTVNLAAKWGVTTPQGKVNFLAAAKDLDFVKKDMGIISVSEGKQKQQEEMIKSAQNQQELMDTAAPFEAVRDLLKTTDGVKASETVPSLSELVENLTKDLSSAKDVDLEALYAADDITKADLLTDTARLMKLVAFVDGDERKKLQLKTQQGLLAWIEKMEKDTGGGLKKEAYEGNTEVKNRADDLDGLYSDSKALLTTMRSRVVGDNEASFVHDTKEANKFSNEFFAKKQEFENFKIKLGDKLKEKDKKELEDSWVKLEAIRAFVLKRAQANKKTRETFKGYEEKKGKLKLKSNHAKKAYEDGEKHYNDSKKTYTDKQTELATLRNGAESESGKVKAKERAVKEEERKVGNKESEISDLKEEIRNVQRGVYGVTVQQAKIDAGTARSALNGANMELFNAKGGEDKAYKAAQRNVEQKEKAERKAQMVYGLAEELKKLKAELRKVEKAKKEAVGNLNTEKNLLVEALKEELDQKKDVKLKEQEVDQAKAAVAESNLKELKREWDQAVEKKQEYETTNKVSLDELADEQTRIEGDLMQLKRKTVEWTENDPTLNLESIDDRITQSLRVDNFADELDKKFVEQLEKNDQFEQLKGVSKGTKVSITYKETSATNLRFPDQLNGNAEDFVVVKANNDGVLLEKVGAGGKTISILGPVAKGGSAYKNAKVATTSGTYAPATGTTPATTTTSGAWSSAVAYNFKIAA